MCFKYQHEDDRQTVEMLNYYFYKVVFLKVVSLPLFILQHDRIQKDESRVCNVSVPTYQTTRGYVNIANYLHFYYVFSKIFHTEYLKNT